MGDIGVHEHGFVEGPVGDFTAVGESDGDVEGDARVDAVVIACKLFDDLRDAFARDLSEEAHVPHIDAEQGDVVGACKVGCSEDRSVTAKRKDEVDLAISAVSQERPQCRSVSSSRRATSAAAMASGRWTWRTTMTR